MKTTKIKVLVRPARWWLERAVKRYIRKGWTDTGVRSSEKIASVNWWLTIVARRRR